MSAAGKHFTSEIKASPFWFESNVKFVQGTKRADSSDWVEGFCVVDYFPFNFKFHVFSLQLMQVATEGGLVCINVVERMLVGPPSGFKIVASWASIGVGFTTVH